MDAAVCEVKDEAVVTPSNAVTAEKAVTDEAVKAVRSDVSDDSEEMLAAIDVNEPPEDREAVDVRDDKDLGGEAIIADMGEDLGSDNEIEMLGTAEAAGSGAAAASSA